MNFKNRQSGNFLAGLGIVAIIGYICLFAAFIYGYVCNILSIIGTLGDPITGLFIARCFGVVAAPLGAILGYF